MKNILVIGAGLSSSYLIKYLTEHATKDKWKICVADANLELAKSRIKNKKNTTAIQFDVNKKPERETEIQKADIVVSLLPPTLHIKVAKDCIRFKKHLVTASYITEAMKALNKKALDANVILLNEIGLDPGIDHLSAMQMIQDIQKSGAEIVSFKSYCGGLIAPEFDTNPWHYKFTWNPRNVVLAGQATVKYLEKGKVKFIPQSQLFLQTEKIKIDENLFLESYANRDSLNYILPYGIQNAKTVLRGTLRKIGFCKSWNNIVKLGLTDDSYKINTSENLTYRELLVSLISNANDKNVENKLCSFLKINKSSIEFKKIKWLGLFERKKIEFKNASPAQILQNLLQQKWKLQADDLDLIVMKHEIIYQFEGKKFKKESSLIVKGENETYTAMAKTVGLPMAIAAKLILQNKIKSRGVVMPVAKEFYEPILKELKKYNVVFNEI